MIHFFEPSEEYLSFLREELQERIDVFGISKEYMQQDIRFIRYHNRLLNRNKHQFY